MEEDRSASFVELFFDLVFVFGVTQVVASIHGHLDWPTLWRAAVVLLLLWWAWTQYTWVAGFADFDDLRPRLVLLLATAGTFAMAVSVQNAWGDDGAEFAIAYTAVMVLAGVFIWLGNRGTDRMDGVVPYVGAMLAATALVLVGGFAAVELRPWFWVAGAAVNIFSATAAQRYEYDISPAHFAERHGLFVIIVLGEVLIAIGIGTVGHPGSAEFFVAGTAMLVVALSMWWSYFDWLFRVGETALKAATGVARGRLARDAYSLSHYPLVAGVILFAVGTEELLAHPELPLDGGARWAFLGGLMMFLASQAVMAYRFKGARTWERYIAIGLLAGAAVVLTDVASVVVAVVACVLLVGTLGVETARHQEALRALR